MRSEPGGMISERANHTEGLGSSPTSIENLVNEDKKRTLVPEFCLTPSPEIVPQDRLDRA